MEKQCRVCKEMKPLDGFHKDNTKVGGIRSICKPCACAYRDAHCGRAVKVVRMADCHPDRKYYVKGLCELCYNRKKYRKNYKPCQRVYNYKPITCGHNDVAYGGNGLCNRCYRNQYVCSKMADCHPERTHHARGLCESCYRGEQNRKRDAKLKGKGHHSQKEWKDIVSRYPCCPRCRKLWSEVGEPTRDHIVSVYDGGNDRASNIQPLCFSCNSQKQKRSQYYPPVEPLTI